MQIQSNNFNNWTQLWQLPISPSQNQYKDTIVCPILFQSPITAMFFGSNEAVIGDWQVAGYVNQLIKMPTLANNEFAVTSGGSKLFFNKLQIVKFPFWGEYALEFSINSWVRQGGNFTIWEYKGEIQTQPAQSIEQAALEKQLTDLSELIDSLSNIP